MFKIIILLTLVTPFNTFAANAELINFCAVDSEYHKACKLYGDNFAWGDKAWNYRACCQSQNSYNFKIKAK